MLKIIAIVVFMVPGSPEPQILKKDVPSYEACIAEVGKIKAKAEELSAKGGPSSEFTLMSGCQFISTKSDPA